MKAAPRAHFTAQRTLAAPPQMEMAPHADGNRSRFLVLVVFQASLKLSDGFINGLNRIHAVPPKIMIGVFQVISGHAQGLNGVANFR
ncbi:MAG: hypothetical protein ACRD41_12745, partial [Candidatus Acidiferrales bacterium]